MKRLLLSICFLFALVGSALATDITVAPFPIPNYAYGGSTAKIRLYSSDTWTDSSGVVHLAGIAGNTTGFYQEISVSVSGGTALVAGFVTPSTTDSIDRPQVRITAVLFDYKGQRRDTLFQNWVIPPSPTSTTWAALVVVNNAKPKPFGDTYSTTAQVSSLILTAAEGLIHETPSGAINGSNAVFTLSRTPIAGSLHLFRNGFLQTPGAPESYTLSGSTVTFSIPPDPGDALSVDYRITSGLVNNGAIPYQFQASDGSVLTFGNWQDGRFGQRQGTSIIGATPSADSAEVFVANYGSLSLAIDGIGSGQRTLVIDSLQVVATDLTIPANVILRFTNTGGIQPANTKTVDIQSDGKNWPLRQIFFNALSGQGTISFSGNKSLSTIYAQWFGAVGDVVFNGDSTTAGDGTINSGTPDFSSASSSFPTSIVGQSISIVGTGATFTTTVLARPSSTSLTLAANASSSTTTARFVWGTSNTAAVQAALTAAGTGPIPTVKLMRGAYFFPTGSLTIPANVSLEGEWTYRPSFQTAWLNANVGSLLVVTATEGTATGRFISMPSANSSLRGFGAYYPAEYSTLATPKLYPWFVEANGVSAKIENLALWYPYQGIYSHGGGRHIVRDITGFPIALGLYASQQLSSSTYENIQFEDNSLTTLDAWVAANGIGVKLGRVDDALVNRVFGFGYNEWLQLNTDSADGQGPGGSAWATVHGGGGDSSGNIAVHIVETQGGTSATAQGVNFVGTFIQTVGSGTAGVYVNSTYTGRTSFTSCVFQNSMRGLWYTAGATGSVGLVNNYFQAWTNYALQLDGPAATTIGRVNLTNNHFLQAGPTVSLSGRITGGSANNYYAGATTNVFVTANTTMFNVSMDFFATDGRTLTGIISATVNNFISFDPTGVITISSPTGAVKLNPVVFASLPASPIFPMYAVVSDSNTNVWGAVVAGGGANKILAYFNGTAWTVVGK